MIVHDLHDAGARWLADALNAQFAPGGPRVESLSLLTLTTAMRWRLFVETAGTACRLDSPSGSWTAGTAPHADAHGSTIAGVINRSRPVVFPPHVTDGDYKSAEWNALIVAWLHGLPCAVINRPRPDRSDASPAAWRRRAAVHRLPIWPLPLVHAGVPNTGTPAAAPGLLVVGDDCIEAVGQPPWPSAAKRAAVAAAAESGCDLLTWLGAPDANGQWRIADATPHPDLRPFGPAAVTRLADRIVDASRT